MMLIVTNSSTSVKPTRQECCREADYTRQGTCCLGTKGWHGTVAARDSGSSLLGFRGFQIALLAEVGHVVVVGTAASARRRRRS